MNVYVAQQQTGDLYLHLHPTVAVIGSSDPEILKEVSVMVGWM